VRVSWDRCEKLYAALGLEWFPPQRDTLANRESPFIIFAGGAGAGKTRTGAGYLLPELLQENKLYWIVASTFALGRYEFQYLVEWLQQAGVGFAQGPNMPQEGQWYMRLDTGTQVVTQSATQPEAFHGAAVDGMIVAEAGQLNLWFVQNRLMPRVLRAHGRAGWILFEGTFEGADTWYADYFWKATAGEIPDWSAYSMASWENTVTYPGGRKDEKILIAERQMPGEEFMQRFGAVPMSPVGIVMKEWSTERHVSPRAEYNPEWPVQVWVDVGRQYAVLAVHIVEGGKVWVFDEIFLPDGGSAERAIREATSRPWWKNVEGGWIDIAAPENAETWRSGAIYDTLSRERGEKVNGVILRSMRVDVNPGIERTRTMLHSKVMAEQDEPDAWLYEGQKGISRILVNPRCVTLIREASLYRYAHTRGGGTIEKTPVDANNHCFKAVAYGLVGNFGYSSPWAIRMTRVDREAVCELA